jgi:hypothetical protein
MKRYRVDLSFTTYNTYYVDAKNAQDAIDKAAGLYDDGVKGVWDGCDPQRWPEEDMAEEIAPEAG